ncbi:MAG: molybdopterin cofactor-binding domain-containing protein [Casimicrobiaceae bacterium]
MTHPAEAFLTALTDRKVDRRGFLTFAAKGLALAFALPVAGRIGSVVASPSPGLATAYIRIGTDGTITLAFGGAEMGQGSMSGLAQILAEELLVDWNQVTVVQSLVDPVVSYLTGGSSAVRGRYATLRDAGAAARELLIAAAMGIKGDANRNNYTAAGAKVVHVPSNTVWPYGTLATGAVAQTVPADLRLTDPKNFRLIGHAVPRIDIPAKTDGSAKYGIDTWFPDMVFAAIKHCPTIGGTLAKTPGKPSGAIAVVPCSASDSRGAVLAGSINAVAVVASNTWLAFRLANSLNAQWTLPASTSGVDSAQILAQATALASSGAALIAEPAPPSGLTPATYAPVIEAQVSAALGTPTLNATYTLPYLAHATMEVLNCTVNIVFNGAAAQSCEIWAPTQGAPFVASLAQALTGLPPAQIIVHTTLLGGGLGRKFELDYVSQAIQVALVVKKPVKLTWRREEDFAHDQYRPCAVVNVKATLDSGKKIKAWAYRNVSQAILGQRGWLPPGAVDSQAVEGSVRLPYALGTYVAEWVPLSAGIPVGFWRSVGSSINAFAVECMMDELAMAAGVDPFVFRYSHLTDARTEAVIRAADVLSSWRKSLAAGHAWGMAFAESFGTRVCQVVEISKATASAVTVNRIACVVDCGTVINPDSVEAQMQGGILHALNAALWGQSTFTAGKAAQTNFNKYRVMRIKEMPQVTVQIIASGASPAGVGEPGVPPLAPALANAYARLTGLRARTLPLFPFATMGDG